LNLFKSGGYVRKESHCPWCGADALGFWEKQTLGLVPRKCHNCSHLVRASWPSVLQSIAIVLVPFGGAMIYGHSAQLGELASFCVSAAGLAVGGGLAMAWQQGHLQLVRHEGGRAQPG
jgi:hypothetical protein